jgi:biopolymer transport protein ExbD
MAFKSGGLERKSKASQEIPSSSLADIAFLLLIFFMVTTVFKSDKERDITWPVAEATQKIDEKQKDILNIWVERDGTLYINDQPFPMDQVSEYVRPLYAQSERRLVISIRGDREVPYLTMDQIQKELVSANVVRVTFATALEQRMTRQRR